MFAVIYKQAYDEPVAEIKYPDYDYFTFPCPDCEGTGVFSITNTDSQPCVVCKTSGVIWVSN
jgi:DnaJ-class molecular chaperone